MVREVNVSGFVKHSIRFGTNANSTFSSTFSGSGKFVDFREISENSENLSITSYVTDKIEDDMSTINFNNLENIPEYNNDPKNNKLAIISENNNELIDNNLSTTS